MGQRPAPVGPAELGEVGERVVGDRHRVLRAGQALGRGVEDGRDQVVLAAEDRVDRGGGGVGGLGEGPQGHRLRPAVCDGLRRQRNQLSAKAFVVDFRPSHLTRLTETLLYNQVTTVSVDRYRGGATHVRRLTRAGWGFGPTRSDCSGRRGPETLITRSARSRTVSPPGGTARLSRHVRPRSALQLRELVVAPLLRGARARRPGRPRGRAARPGGSCRRWSWAARRTPAGAPAGRARGARGRARGSTSAVSRVGSWPGASTTYALGTASRTASGAGTTAASATAGCSMSTRLELERADLVVAGLEDVVGAADVGDVAVLVAARRRRRCGSSRRPSPRRCARRRPGSRSSAAAAGRPARRASRQISPSPTPSTRARRSPGRPAPPARRAAAGPSSPA